MGYPTRIQQIRRKKSSQWYVNMPAALASAIELKKGEIVEWIVKDNMRLILKRQKPEDRKEKLPRGKRAMSIREKFRKSRRAIR